MIGVPLVKRLCSLGARESGIDESPDCQIASLFENRFTFNLSQCINMDIVFI